MSYYNPYFGYPQQNIQQPQMNQPFPGMIPPPPPFGPLPEPPTQSDEQSYIENILRLNKGKIATVYMNFENSQWGSKVFKGKIEAAGTDHIILSDVNSNMRYLLLTIYLNYITFDEEIVYQYPFQNQMLPER